MLDRPNPEGNVYVVTLLNADGPLRTLHRDKLLDARELVPEMEADHGQESRITTNGTTPLLVPKCEGAHDKDTVPLRFTILYCVPNPNVDPAIVK